MKYNVGDTIAIKTDDFQYGPTIVRKVTRICEYANGDQCLYWKRGNYEKLHDLVGALHAPDERVTLLKTKCTDMEDTRAYLEAITQ